LNDEGKEIYIESPKILVTQYIPMGKNNMVSINRHIGAHKAYKLIKPIRRLRSLV